MPARNNGVRPPRGRLELTWVGKESRSRLEPRVLVEDPKLSYGDPRSENILIHGDNLLALKALEQDFAGKIKCVYIDPPFNTGQAMEHYDDGLEHSIWLSLMADRLRILHGLLTPDGTLFAHIDDNELGYLLVLLDEIFGRPNRLFVVTFKQGSATGHKAINPGCVNTSNFVLMYARERDNWAPNRVFTARGRDPRYNLFIENKHADFRKWRFTTLMRAYAAASGSTEHDARSAITQRPDLIDQFVLEHAESVVQMARPNYEGVGAAARHLIDESKLLPDGILRLERDGYSDIFLKGGMRILFYSDKLLNIP